MDVEAIAPAASPGAGSSPPVVAAPFRSWTCDAVAVILSAVLRSGVRPESLRDRAIALGLLRHGEPGRRATLSAKAASRLLLCGYRLPAQAEVGATTAALRGHLADGRRVFVALDDPEEPTVCEVTAVHEESFGEPWLSIVELRAGAGGGEQWWPLERFAEVWAAAGAGLVVAAADWRDLPTSGPLFFGGLRDCDGAYHWTTAECDTDRDGRILRF